MYPVIYFSCNFHIFSCFQLTLALLTAQTTVSYVYFKHQKYNVRICDCTICVLYNAMTADSSYFFWKHELIGKKEIFEISECIFFTLSIIDRHIQNPKHYWTSIQCISVPVQRNTTMLVGYWLIHCILYFLATDVWLKSTSLSPTQRAAWMRYKNFRLSNNFFFTEAVFAYAPCLWPKIEMWKISLTH